MDLATRTAVLVPNRTPDEVPGSSSPPTGGQIANVRRFVKAVVIGAVVAGVGFCWTLFDLWTGFHPFRIAYNDDFYDAQARAILHGHLWMPKSVLDIEAFKHGTHYYTYFGIFPSLLRIPLIWIPHLYGHLTAPFLFVAWICVALLSSMLLWRIRIFVRGNAALGLGEASCYGALVACICGSAVIMVLAAMPWVYDEDIFWSIALTVGAMFGLLGMVERPSGRRLAFTGVFVLCANLNRLPTGWACVVATALVGLWLAAQRGPEGTRRWGVPLLAVAAVSLAAGCVITWLKFGSPFALPLGAQTWTQVNAHRREYLARNGGKGYNFGFFPTDFWSYFQPFGIRFQSVFPYVTLPAVPPTILFGAYMDQWYRTASIPPSMPLLFLSGCLGAVASFMRQASRTVRALRFLVVAGVVAFGVALVWSYIAPRFEGDGMPLLIVAAAIGVVQLWKVLDRHSKWVGRLALSAVCVLAVYSLVAGFGIGISPNMQWSPVQTAGFVRTELTLSNLTGHPINAEVTRGTVLPHYAPAGRIFIAGNCQALYIANGEDYINEPLEYAEHDSWLPVEQSYRMKRTVRLGFQTVPVGASAAPQPIVGMGPYTLSVQVASFPSIRLVLTGPGSKVVGSRFALRRYRSGEMDLTMDPYLQLITATWNSTTVFSAFLPDHSAPVFHTRSAGSHGGTTVTVKLLAQPRYKMRMCRALLRAS